MFDKVLYLSFDAATAVVNLVAIVLDVSSIFSPDKMVYASEIFRNEFDDLIWQHKA